tara:strand:+ start:947 stop:1924 length:978 start_codon:yes stop_codon:yes gene_type:complete
MQLNGVELTERFNRPSVGGKVALRAMFINDGQYQDPYDVSACTIFTKLANATPDSIVGTDGLIKSDQEVSSILMNFGVSGQAGADHDGQPGRTTSENAAWVATTLYAPEPQASGIYKTGTGQYVAVLDGSIALSGGYNMHFPFGGGFTVANGASAVQEYIDVWTAKMTATSEYQLFINEVRLDNDAWISLTQPLLLSTSNRLVNKHITLGSIVNLKVTTDLTVQNRDLDSSVRNIIESYGIDNAFFKIQKVNEGTTSIPSLETVFDYRNVDQITSDNTMIYNFNVDNWMATAGLSGGDVGTFALTASYTFLGETFKTKPLYFTIS